MALKTIDQNPTIGDIVLFDLYTTDADGNYVDPYKVNLVTIYFVERDYVTKGFQSYEEGIKDFVSTFYYKNAVPFKTFGSDDYPAWLSSDTANAFLSKVDFVDDVLEVGHFQLEWTPELGREGDYFLCYTWTPVAGGDSLSKVFHFYLGGNYQPPIIPSHRTNPSKYSTLLERYTPDMFKQFLVSSDLTPDIINRTNLAVADGFTLMENFYAQLIDLLDANAVNDAFLPYLANFFRLKLRSHDSTLWRRQVRTAIALLKKKGTIGGLKEALAQAGIIFKKLTYYWQVVSKATWQEAFIVTNQSQFQLAKKVLLPVDEDNFHVFYRPNGDADYTELDLDYVLFTVMPGTNVPCVDNTPDISYVTWQGQNVYSAPISLKAGDVVRVVYKVAQPVDQQLENYIQTLPLADQRDELAVAEPVKNWNVRLIAENDFLFDVICHDKNGFAYPLVYGKIRTEFPYSENVYNMDEYDGSTRDSNNPCDIDGSFYDVCTSCRSSKVAVDVWVEQLSNDRITETAEVVEDFLPFHAVVQSINYAGLNNELIPPPLERLECLIQNNLEDDVVMAQFNFNRVIHDGLSDADTIKRDMLADAQTAASGDDGVGYNLAYVIFSPGVDFSIVGISDDNLLEVLSGTNQGEYELISNGGASADVAGLSQFPLDQSGFPFRFSNGQYEEIGASVYQDNVVIFSDPDIDFSLFSVPDGGSWVIRIKTGPYMGVYPIETVTSANSFVISGWGAGSVGSLPYDFVAPGNVNVLTGTGGTVAIQFRGRVETAFVEHEYDVKKGDYVVVGGQQYKLLYFGDRTTVDKLYIDGYSGGDQVGSVNVRILRRLVEDTIGYFNFRGMRMRTTVNYESTLGIQNGRNPVSNPLDNSDFKENYFVLIGSSHYQMADIDGNDIYLAGPVQNWGLAGETVNVDYSIIQLVNHPVTVQDGRTGEFATFYPFVDRRGDGIFIIEQNLPEAPMALRMHLLNKLGRGETIAEAVQAKESIRCKFVLKK